MNGSSATCYIDSQVYNTAVLMNMILAYLLPFIAFITSSSLVIYSMKIAREKIFQSNSAVAKKISIRDFQFARTILIMDLAYLFFNYPIVIFQIAFSSITIDPQSVLYNILVSIEGFLLYLYLCGRGINFLIYLIFNNNFRSEFLLILHSVMKNYISSIF